MKTDRRLIFDIGVHKGEDTGYYLQKGYKVVGIEANPDLVTKLSAEFADAIGRGDLQIEPICVGDHNGQISFFVNDKVTEWSSTDKRLGSRGEAEAREMTLDMVTIDHLFEKHGVPYYLKVDIEGMDGVALKPLIHCEKLPVYVSYEASSVDGLCHLYSAGYTMFKLVRQRATAGTQLPGDTDEDGNPVSWTFPRGSSGPFGEQTPGKWSRVDDVVTDLVKFLNFDRNDPRQLRDWIDIHAKHPTAGESF